MKFIAGFIQNEAIGWKLPVERRIAKAGRQFWN